MIKFNVARVPGGPFGGYSQMGQEISKNKELK